MPYECGSNGKPIDMGGYGTERADGLACRRWLFLTSIGNALRAVHPLEHLWLGRRSRPAAVDGRVGQWCRLADELLALSELAGDHVELRIELTDLRLVTEQAFLLARPLIERHKIRLTISLPEQSLWIHADANRLRQALISLTGGLARIAEPGTEVALSVHQAEECAIVRSRCARGTGWLRFNEADAMAGYESPEDIEMAFALARKIVERHGGTMAYCACAPGIAHEICVRLPVAREREIGAALGPIGSNAPSMREVRTQHAPRR